MARNKYGGYCYCCKKYTQPGYGHFERYNGTYTKWRLKCVECASGRKITDDDPCVKRIKKELEKEQKERNKNV